MSLLPGENGWDNCNRTAHEHKTLPGRSCTYLDVGSSPPLRTLVMHVGQIFRADMTRASRLQVVRYRPGSPGVPCHVDKYLDKSINDVSFLVYLTTAAHPSSGLTVFEKAGVSIRPTSGTALAWMSSHINSEHSLAPIHLREPHDRFALQIGLSLNDLGDNLELPHNMDSAFWGDYTPDCASWCNVWTCSVWGCLDCPQTVHVCKDLHEGKYCAGWCNDFTSTLSHCLGCNQTSMPRSGNTSAQFLGIAQSFNMQSNGSTMP